MPGPLGRLLGTRLLGTYLRFWLAALGAAILAMLAGGLAIKTGGTLGVAVLLLFGAGTILAGAILLAIVQ